MLITKLANECFSESVQDSITMRIKNVREAINDWGLLHDQKKKKKKTSIKDQTSVDRLVQPV